MRDLWEWVKFNGVAVAIFSLSGGLIVTLVLTLLLMDDGSDSEAELICGVEPASGQYRCVLP